MNKRLHPLYEIDGAIGAESGVEATPAAEVQVETEVTADQTGVEAKDAADPEKQNNFEKAFAKRLAAKEAEWEAKNSEKYKDYETLKKTTEYFQQRHGYNDLMTMKEDIELAELQDRAAKENVSPEMLKRIDELEEKAAKGDKLEQEQQEIQRVTAYFSTMDKFLEGKGVESKELNQFMVDNGLQYDPENMGKSFDIAYKAMKADEYEKKANEKEADTIKRYLATKNAPKVEGSTGAAAAQTVDTRKMSWDQLDRHAAERVKALNTPQ